MMLEQRAFAAIYLVGAIDKKTKWWECTGCWLVSTAFTSDDVEEITLSALLMRHNSEHSFFTNCKDSSTTCKLCGESAISNRGCGAKREEKGDRVTQTGRVGQGKIKENKKEKEYKLGE